MFNIPILIFVTAIFALIQISVWQIFPEKFKHILFANPIFAFIVNLAGSALVASFTGVASIVGVCNLAASVVFGIYATICSKNLGIKGLTFQSFKMFNLIPVFPKLMVVYEKEGRQWIA